MINPVIRYDGNKWQRLTSGIIHENPGGNHFGYWEVKTPKKFFDVAFCFPHGPIELENFVKHTRWNFDSIGISQKGRHIIRVSNSYGTDKKQPGIYCIAHQHASEMPGAWALQGFLLEIAKMKDDAPIVWAVPILDIDGTIDGNYGKDSFPWDLNRAWGYPPMRIEVSACMRDI